MKAEDFISLIEQNRFDKISQNGMILIAERFRQLEPKQCDIPIVIDTFSQNDMENFAAKCMVLGSNGKEMNELLQDFCDNDL